MQVKVAAFEAQILARSQSTEEASMGEELRNRRLPMLSATTLAALALAASTEAGAVDAAAAEGLARQSACFKCHAVDTKKVGPAWKETAAKYKSDKDAEAKLTKHLSGGGKMQYGGKEQDHPAAKSKKPEEIKNLVDWILSL
jgi:cytochrome c